MTFHLTPRAPSAPVPARQPSPASVVTIHLGGRPAKTWAARTLQTLKACWTLLNPLRRQAMELFVIHDHGDRVPQRLPATKPIHSVALPSGACTVVARIDGEQRRYKVTVAPGLAFDMHLGLAV